jgi:hypothetical protein
MALQLPARTNQEMYVTTTFFIFTCFYPPIKTHALQEPLSHIPATQPAQLLASLSKFSTWLSGLEVVQSPRLARLTHQRLNFQIHHAALARLAKTYETLCEEVKKPENKYEAASTLLGSERPFGQVHLLWQIFGLQEDEVEESTESEGSD